MRSLSNVPRSDSETSPANTVRSGQVFETKDFLITENRQKSFDLRMATQLDRLATAADLIMDRHLRNKVSDIAKILENIRENCQRDPLDINEETHLPVVIEEMIAALTEFGMLIPHQNPPSHLIKQRHVIDSILDQAKPWLEQVFERMLTNDQSGLEVRARVLSGVFERGKRLHQVESDIRKAIKEKNT